MMKMKRVRCPGRRAGNCAASTHKSAGQIFWVYFRACSSLNFLNQGVHAA